MIKRPMLFVLLFYTAGCYTAGITSINSSDLLWLTIFLNSLFFISLCIYQGVTHHILKEDYFLFSLPFCVVLGFLLSQNAGKIHPMESIVSNRIEGTIVGTVSNISDRADYSVLTMENNTIWVLDENGRGGNYSQKEYYSNRLIVYANEDADVLIGNKISVQGKITKFTVPTNEGQFNEALYYRTRKTDFKVTAKKIKILEHSVRYLPQLFSQWKSDMVELYSLLLPQKDAGIVDAILLGEKTYLDQEEKRLYEENGISHILAISGLHITLIGMFIFRLFRILKFSYFLSSAFAGVLIFQYGVLTNFGISTKRAVFMIFLLFGSTILGRTYDMLTAASAGAVLLLLDQPLYLYDCGFLLSFGAVFGIGFIVPFLEPSTDTIETGQVFHTLLQSLCVSLGILIMTVPISLYFFYELPSFGLLVNILILPFVSILVMSSIAGGILGHLYLPAGEFLVGATHYILLFYHKIGSFFSSLPLHMLYFQRPEIWKIMLYYGLLTAVIILAKKRKSRKYFLCLIASVVLFYQTPSGLLSITVLDIGQGDGIYIQTPNGTSCLIDGGSSNISKVGTYRILPFLKSQGIRSLDYMMLTHSDKDHISGAMELIQLNKEGRFRIHTIILPKIDMEDISFSQIEELAEESGTQVYYFEAGDGIVVGEVLLNCIHPSFDYKSSSKNDMSLVISLEYREFSMLFTGDLEKEGEMHLVRTNRLQDYDLLKVAHHGSKHSTFEEFLNHIKPEISVISCALENSYGHPGEELIQRLHNSGSRIYSTSIHGAVTIVTDGEYIKFDGWVKNRKADME